MKTTSQRIKIRAHLMAGRPITQRQAIALCQCYRLAHVIWKLRHKYGVPIATEIVRAPGKNPYAKYRIERSAK